MRFRGLGCWGALTCVVSALVVTTGCDIIPEGDDGRSGDDGPRDPGSMWSSGGPGGTDGTPVVRKLALDLRGVAGFAILDAKSDSSDTSPAPGDATGTADPSLSGGAASSGSGASFLWLSSSSVGQELRAGQGSIDGAALRETILGRRGMGDATGAPSRDWAAQQDPSGAPAPGVDGAGDSALPEPPPTDDNAEETSVGEQAGLLKITQDGDVEPALVALEETPLAEPAPGGADAGAPSSTGVEPGDPSASPGPSVQHFEPMPRVTALGLSPDGNVYVLFERSFMYRQPSLEEITSGADVFGPTSPYRCQLFRANGSWQEGSAQSLAELECVTNEHEVRTWDTKRVMQFDASGKLYFRAALPMQSKEVFYQYDPVTRALSEKVNGNICWRDVQVTPRGSLFYTGTTGSNGDCGGTSFFRYVSADNRLTEIARDWWNFKYLAEQDPDDPTNERIIFYGPDPNSTSAYGWDTACLYRYNPAAEDPTGRVERLVECSTDPYRYVFGTNPSGEPMSDEEFVPFSERCQSDGQLFVGGEGVTGLSQLQDGTLFVIGKFQKKVAGEVHCRMEATVDHCTSLDPAHDSQEACEAAGQQWVFAQDHCSDAAYQDPFECESNEGTWLRGTSYSSYEVSGAACLTSPREGVARGFVDCRPSGSGDASAQGGLGLTREVNGLAYLAPRADATGSELVLLSDPTEKVERYWALEGENGPELYYSVYAAGQYSLRLATQVEVDGQVEVQRRLLLEDYEVYNLQRDPADPRRVMFDALNFATNEYLFGSADASLATPEEVLASVEAVQGVSGRVETLIVLPNF